VKQAYQLGVRSQIKAIVKKVDTPHVVA